MALKKTLAEKLFNISKISSQALTICRISSSRQQSRIAQSAGNSAASIALDPGDNSNGVFRRFLHKRAVFSPELRKLPLGENLVEKLREMNIAKDRVRLAGLGHHLEVGTPAARQSDLTVLTVEEARKLMRAAQLELVKTRLRETGKSWIAYSEFVEICGEGCSDPEEGLRIAKVLDESGTVIVLGNNVALRPEQVAKDIGGLIPLPGASPNDPRRKELEELEKQKAAIDKKADLQVRRELWCGLAYLVVQTAGFMRLTFWELSWDVMEPICFYVTSMYFMAGYAFFLRTSKEPSFEGFYQSRFIAKQKKLMEVHNLDAARYNKLHKLFYPYSLESSQQAQAPPTPSFNQIENL